MSEIRPLPLEITKAKPELLEQEVPCDENCPSCSGAEKLAASCIINEHTINKVYFPKEESEMVYERESRVDRYNKRKNGKNY